jgi:CHAT domain-containing protein
MRALHIWEKALGREHRYVAASLNNLASIYEAQGLDRQAEPLRERALRVSEKALGPEHPTVAISLKALAMLSWCSGDASRALRYLSRAVAIRERHLDLTLGTLSEPRKRQLLGTQDGEASVLVSFHAHGAPDSVDALAQTLTATLRRKGRVLQEVANEQAALRRNLSLPLQAELDRLQAKRAELAIRSQTPHPDHLDELQALAQDIERRVEELSRKSASFRTHTVPPTIESVQAVLPENAALVEFVYYQRIDPNSRPQRWREARYVAYVLRREGPPQWVALGEAEPIEAAVTAAMSALSRCDRDPRKALRALDELVFAPVRRRLGPTGHFLISPDAALHLVPFAALVDENGDYLVDRLPITYLTTGRDLLRAAAPDETRSKPLIAAISQFPKPWNPIPGAEAEARAIQKHFVDVELHLGRHATKDKLTAARGPLFVHVATHGFFRPSRASASPSALRSWRDERDIVIAPDLPHPPENRPDVEDALDDAGLVLAGGTEGPAYLSAREIAGINLRGTQLVVLSACDTGVGQIELSEGIYGLRRALEIAGTETQVVSLWQVDDDATRWLMDRYYGALHSGAGRSDALGQAQRELLRDARYEHPFYWAAFVPIGDPRPLRLPPRHR